MIVPKIVPNILCNTCNDTIKEFLQQSFPNALIDEYGEELIIDNKTHYCEQVNVENIDEVSDCLRLYKLYYEI